MPPSFDLRDEPWIPVRESRQTVRVGLRELFLRAHEFQDIEVPIPPAASGLMRILYAVAARIAVHNGQRLDDEDLAEELDEWLTLRNRILGQRQFAPEAVEEYFNRRVPSSCFDLFDPERPFLQDPRLVHQCTDSKGKTSPSGVNKLVLGRPTGVNGAVLFGHYTDTDPVPVPSAEAAWHLIAQLYYGPSGQCTPRRITSVKPGNGDAGPLRKTVSFHPWAPDLFSTLVIGIPRCQDTEEPESDACPWEEKLPDPLAPLPALTWPGRLLTGRARHAALLVPAPDGTAVTDAYLTWSTHQPAHEARDPYIVPVLSKEGRLYARPADTDRAVWRDLDALLLKSKEERTFRRPRIFDDLDDLPVNVRDVLRVRAYGFHQDGQQRDSGWYVATTPPVLRWLEEADPVMAVRVSACRRAAEELGRTLDYAAKLAWAATNTTGDKEPKIDSKKPGPWSSAAAVTYWPQAERIFWQLTNPDTPFEAPHRKFAAAAERALVRAMGLARSDLRGAKAHSHARAVIRKAVPAAAPSGTTTKD